MLVLRQLEHGHGLLLPIGPVAALLGAAEVDGAVAVAVQHGGIHVGELIRVLEGLRRGDPAAVQAVDGHAGWREVVDQRLGLLMHGPAVLKANVLVEPLVVQHCVVGGRRLDEDLKGEKPDSLKVTQEFESRSAYLVTQGISYP